MRILGVVLIVVGIAFVIICFLGTAMMSRSVHWFTEAVLPALIGVVVAAIGILMVSRAAPPKEPKSK
jgi:multisubunit Na+/H+ antiporter MnhG subunit